LNPEDRLDGWKEIAGHVGRSESWCKYMATSYEPEEMRMPVWKLGRTPCITRQDLDNWVAMWRELKRLGAK